MPRHILGLICVSFRSLTIWIRDALCTPWTYSSVHIPPDIIRHYPKNGDIRRTRTCSINNLCVQSLFSIFMVDLFNNAFPLKLTVGWTVSFKYVGTLTEPQTTTYAKTRPIIFLKVICCASLTASNKGLIHKWQLFYARGHGRWNVSGNPTHSKT